LSVLLLGLWLGAGAALAALAGAPALGVFLFGYALPAAAWVLLPWPVPASDR
jgi:hypothetical protein